MRVKKPPQKSPQSQEQQLEPFQGFPGKRQGAGTWRNTGGVGGGAYSCPLPAAQAGQGLGPRADGGSADAKADRAWLRMVLVGSGCRGDKPQARGSDRSAFLQLWKTKAKTNTQGSWGPGEGLPLAC